MFAWYWLTDLCEDQHISFVLRHTLYLKRAEDGLCSDILDIC